MKVFISHPCSGLTEQEINLSLMKAVKDIRNRLNPVKVEIIDWFIPEDSYLVGLGKSIANGLSEADCVYFAEGWEQSTGCIIERTIVELLGIPFFSADKTDANCTLKV